MVDSVLAHRDELGDHVVLLSDGEPLFMGVKEGVALALVEGGFDVHFPLTARYFVHDQRLVERDEVDGAVVLVLDHATPSPTPEGGELVLDLELEPGLGVDPEAWDELVGQVEASTPPTRAELGAALADLPPDEAVLWTEIVRSAVGRPAQRPREPRHPRLPRRPTRSGPVARPDAGRQRSRRHACRPTTSSPAPAT